jgi:SAM-dependent methyltransferase
VPSVVYDEPVAEAFAHAREMSPRALAAWEAPVRRHLGQAAGGTIVDVGAGTGLFSAWLARLLRATVIAVEPAVAMRRRIPADPRVEVRAGTAERLPLDRHEAQGAWMSTVLHHLDDPLQAARSLAGTLTPGAPVLIRGLFRDRPDPELVQLRFFPEAHAALERFPALGETAAWFARAGLQPVAYEEVRQPVASRLSALAPRLDRTADTLLRDLPDTVFEAGRRAMLATAREADEPVFARLGLLVLR